MPVQVACPSCGRQLKVPDHLAGKMVKCPNCQQTFQAAVGGVPPPLPPQEEPRSSRRPPREDEEQYQEEAPPPARRPRDDDEGDDDDSFDEGEEERPRRRRRRRRDYAPHRGTMILVFAILGWTVCFIFSIVAWVMGNNDLKEIRAGRMDPAGESTTKIGKILGMVQCILVVVIMVGYCLFFGILAATGKLK